MARVIGSRRPRLGEESTRLATTAAALVVGVVAVFLGMRSIQAGAGTGPVVAVLALVVVPGLVIAKFLTDRRLLGGSATRRTQDTRGLGGRLNELPDSWWVFPDVFLGGTGAEFLVIGPGGLFAVEVFRWLARDTGTASHDRVTSDLAARAEQLGGVLTRMTGSREGMPVQPVFVSMEAEGLRIGDLLVHPAATDLYILRGVIVATRENLLSLLEVGGSAQGVRTRPLDPVSAERLAGLLAARGGR